MVGILAPTGTPNDRAAFINLEGFYLIEDHARAFEDKSNPDAEKESVGRNETVQPPRLPLEKRDLTAVLVKAGDPIFAVSMQRPINKRLRVQAVSPVDEITKMLGMFITPVRAAFLALTVVVCIVSAISMRLRSHRKCIRCYTRAMSIQPAEMCCSGRNFARS